MFRKFFSKGGFSLSGENHNQIIPLSENLEENIKKLEMALGKSDDLSVRRLNVSANNIAIIHIEGIVDDQSIKENVISPIIQLYKENHSFTIWLHDFPLIADCSYCTNLNRYFILILT